MHRPPRGGRSRPVAQDLHLHRLDLHGHAIPEAGPRHLDELLARGDRRRPSAMYTSELPDGVPLRTDPSRARDELS